MKVSKSILAAMVVGISVAGVSSSCEKEETREGEEMQVHEPEVCGFGEEGTYDDCPACGQG